MKTVYIGIRDAINTQFEIRTIKIFVHFTEYPDYYEPIIQMSFRINNASEEMLY